MSSLSVLDINPFSDVWFTRLPSLSGGCLLICGWFPLLGAYLWRHPHVDFCPVPSADALEESQWTSQPHSPKACSSAVHLFLLTQLVCGSMRVPFLRSSLGVGAFTHRGRPPLPVAPTLVPRSCPPSTAEGCVLPALSGLLHSGICPLPRSCPPPACMSTLPTCIFKACALHFAPSFPEK